MAFLWEWFQNTRIRDAQDIADDSKIEIKRAKKD